MCPMMMLMYLSRLGDSVHHRKLVVRYFILKSQNTLKSTTTTEMKLMREKPVEKSRSKPWVMRY